MLIHEYEGRIPVYHFDTYRLDDPEAFDAIGPADYFGGEGVCLIEWADRVAEQLPPDCWWLQIEPTGIDARRLRFQATTGILDQVEALFRDRKDFGVDR